MNVVHPIRYALRLEPDLVHFRFSGQVVIELQSRQPVEQVVLNVLELAVWSCKLQMDDKNIPCTFQINPEKEELKIYLPDTLSARFF